MVVSGSGDTPGGQAWHGTVLAVQANFYQVRLEDSGDPQGENRPPQETLLCTRRARLKKMGQQVMVGDRVTIAEPDWAGGRGAIAAIEPRHTQLDRPPVANANQIMLVFSLAEPDLDPHQLSRFLVKAETTGMEITLVLNKRDLVSDATATHWCDRLRQWGYSPIPLSLHQAPGPETVQATLRDRTTIISGPSGVGKSSLINALIPAAALRTGEVSGKLGRGRHTTRHVELFELPGGGLLADTPGFNQPDLACLPDQLAACFPEIRQRLAQGTCQFANCRHQGEPGCIVAGPWERYDHYLEWLAECLETEGTPSSEAEGGVKTKVGVAGQIHHEPRLQAKKYRRVSRRSRHQSLEDLRYTLTDQMDNLDALEDDEAWDI
jgi:ribosome biogenesis GTPase